MTMQYLLQLVISGLVVGSIYSRGRAGVRHHLQGHAGGQLRPGRVPDGGGVRLLRLPRADAHPVLGVAPADDRSSRLVMAMLLERLVLRPMIGEPIISIIMVTIGLVAHHALPRHGDLGKRHPRLRAEALPAGDGVDRRGPRLPGVHLVLRAVDGPARRLLRLLQVLQSRAWRCGPRRSTSRPRSRWGSRSRRSSPFPGSISAVVSGIGGVLIGNINGINSSLYHFGLKVFPATILGGLDSILGAALGGLIIGLLENLSDGLCKSYLDLSGVKEVAPYVILVVILMIKPYGLFGTKEIERV